jgi:hypothetical protein
MLFQVNIDQYEIIQYNLCLGGIPAASISISSLGSQSAPEVIQFDEYFHLIYF